MKQMNQLYTLALALLMATTFQACDNNELTPADVKPEGKVPLKVGLNIDGWGGDASGTRAEGKVDVALAKGGMISLTIAEYGPDGVTPEENTIQCNYFTVNSEGQLVRIPYDKDTPKELETEADIAIGKSKDYFVMSGGDVRLTSGDITYDAYIELEPDPESAQLMLTGQRIPINIENASLNIPYTITSAGLRLIAKDADGNQYSGSDEIIATLTNWEFKGDIPFEPQTLTADQPTAIWGNLKTGVIDAGTQLLRLTVGEKIYKVNVPRIFLEPSQLYTLNVRIGATSIIVSSEELGIDDFELQGTTNADALPQS